MSEDINTEKLDPSQEKPNPNSLINPQKNVPNPPMTYTPLSQNAQPFISKRMKNIKMKKANELINKAEIKRSNYIKKNEFNESPIFSYFKIKKMKLKKLMMIHKKKMTRNLLKMMKKLKKMKILNKIFRIEIIFIISIK